METQKMRVGRTHEKMSSGILLEVLLK